MRTGLRGHRARRCGPLSAVSAWIDRSSRERLHARRGARVRLPDRDGGLPGLRPLRQRRGGRTHAVGAALPLLPRTRLAPRRRLRPPRRAAHPRSGWRRSRRASPTALRRAAAASFDDAARGRRRLGGRAAARGGGERDGVRACVERERERAWRHRGAATTRSRRRPSALSRRPGAGTGRPAARAYLRGWKMGDHRRRELEAKP